MLKIDPFAPDTLVAIAADTLLRFMALQDQFGYKQFAALAEYCKEQERGGLTDAEKHFLLAARAFILDYPAELARHD